MWTYGVCKKRGLVSEAKKNALELKKTPLPPRATQPCNRFFFERRHVRYDRTETANITEHKATYLKITNFHIYSTDKIPFARIPHGKASAPTK